MNKPRNLSDTELIRLFNQGDEAAFAEIYERYWGILLRHAQRMLADEEACRDILQEVFIALWAQVGSLRDDSMLSAYLYRLVRNRILNYMTREKTVSYHLEQLGLFIENRQAVAADSTLLEQELIRIMEEELEAMPEKMRRVFELSRKEHLTHKEIAQELGISTHTVKSQINNALLRLRARMGIFFLLFFG